MSDIQTQLAPLLRSEDPRFPSLSPISNARPLQSIVRVKGLLLSLAGLGLMGLGGCGLKSHSNTGFQAKAAQQPKASTPLGNATNNAQSENGQLDIRANGEDFVRHGFTSKDGWAITFDHVHVGLAEVAALQTIPSVSPQAKAQLNPSQSSSAQDKAQGTAQLKSQAPEKLPGQIINKLEQPQLTVVDLASPDAPTALVAQFSQAPAGRYNSLSWRIMPADSGPSRGHSLQLVGQARQDNRTIDFTLNWDGSYQYVCGDFIGDQRKGFLKEGDRADLEATFHFDHLFGDGDAPPEDEINQNALGFGPLAALSSTAQLSLNRQQLQAQLSAAEFQTLEQAIAGLAHVGEGHCEQIGGPLAQAAPQANAQAEEVQP